MRIDQAGNSRTILNPWAHALPMIIQRMMNDTDIRAGIYNAATCMVWGMNGGGCLGAQVYNKAYISASMFACTGSILDGVIV